MRAYPEHEKLKALGGQNQTIGEFLEWLPSTGVNLCRWLKTCFNCERLNDQDAEECAECGMSKLSSGRFYPIFERTEDLIGQYFGIDPKKLAEEKDEILKEIREAREHA